MGRQHIRNGELHIRQEKTGAPLILPVHPALAAIIEATPGDHLTFLVTKSGKPYRGGDFNAAFRAGATRTVAPVHATDLDPRAGRRSRRVARQSARRPRRRKVWKWRREDLT
jgi:hypothetical protein